MLKMIRFLILPLLLLALAAPAWADDINIYVDQSDDSFTTVPYNGGVLMVSWQTCAPGVPGNNANIYNGQGCLYLFNNTPNTIEELTLSFTAPNNVGVWSGVTCAGDGTFAVLSCPSTIPADGMVTIDFEGGPGVAPYTAFFISEGNIYTDTGVPADEMPETDVLVPTYDPNTIVLLLVGMAMLAMGGIRARRYA